MANCLSRFGSTGMLAQFFHCVLLLRTNYICDQNGHIVLTAIGFYFSVQNKQ